MLRISSHRRALHALCFAAVVPLAVLAMSPVRAGAQCTGDCNADGTVAINELITGVNIALGNSPLSTCTAFDVNSDGMVAINELIAAVSNALGGCPSGNTPTPTVSHAPATATPTPTHTPNGDTPTVGPTVGAGCGNNVIDFAQGETCDDGNRDEGPGDSCPANCKINPCQPSGETLTADVVFATDPADLLLTALTVFVRYPDGVVDVPGANNDPAVQAAVTSDFFSITPNDTNYALTAVLIDPFLFGVQAGTAITIQFDRCGAAGVPPASAFACQVTSATDTTPATVTDQVTCRVALR